MRRRISRFTSVSVAFVVMLVLPLALVMNLVVASPAAAAGRCRAFVGGSNLDSAASPGRAINLKEHSNVAVSGYNGAEIPSGLELNYQIQMQFYLMGSRVSWTIASGVTRGSNWSATVNVDKYAKYGTGLYLLHAISYGTGGQQACSVDGFININPSGVSDAEIGGIVIGGLGIVAVVGAGLVAANEGRKLSDVNELADEVSATGDNEFSTYMLSRCGFFSLLAIPLTVGALAWEATRALASHVRKILS